MLETWEGRSAAEWQRAWQSGVVRFYETTASTNDVVADMAQAGAPHLSIAVAEEQTRGRGRGGSSWQAPRGSALLFSLLFRVPKPGEAANCASVRVALAVADAVARVSGANAKVKWPNDVVIEGCGKVAGILCEGVFGQAGSAQIIAGIGINVNQGRDDFPAELRDHACSIASATGAVVQRAHLLSEIMERCRAFAPRITERFDAAELRRLSTHDVLRGHDVLCEAPDAVRRGVARGIATDGALLIEERGTVHAIYNGTVRLAHSRSYPGSSL